MRVPTVQSNGQSPGSRECNRRSPSAMARVASTARNCHARSTTDSAGSALVTSSSASSRTRCSTSSGTGRRPCSQEALRLGCQRRLRIVGLPLHNHVTGMVFDQRRQPSKPVLPDQLRWSTVCERADRPRHRCTRWRRRCGDQLGHTTILGSADAAVTPHRHARLETEARRRFHPPRERSGRRLLSRS